MYPTDVRRRFLGLLLKIALRGCTLAQAPVLPALVLKPVLGPAPACVAA